MITLTRSQARRLRAVFRRSTLGINHRGVVSELVFRAGDGQLRAQHRYCDLAVEHAEPGNHRSAEIVAVPLDALTDFEGAADTPVTLELVAPDRTVVRWDDRGIPQSKEYHLVTPMDRLEPMPAPPSAWSSCPGTLIDALAEATETGADDSTRYALNCLQLQGGRGQIVATDGRQLLVRSGFTFPWPDALLIKARPIFASRAIPRDRAVEVGHTDTHIVVRAGSWTIACVIQREGRFPAVERVIPQPAEVVTRLRLDPEDAGFLETALRRLPGADDINAPVMIDLNGHVAVRATAADQPGRVTELVLRRSGYTGDPMSVCTDRAMLERALRMGFREIGFTGVESPVVCRAGDRVFAVQPLSGGSPPSADVEVIRIESNSVGATDRRVSNGGEPQPATVTVDAPGREPEQAGVTRRPSIRTAAMSDQPTTLAALIQEAESLHATLADARSRSARLISGLRRHRKQSKLVNETLKSLRQLRLVETAG